MVQLYRLIGVLLVCWAGLALAQQSVGDAPAPQRLAPASEQRGTDTASWRLPDRASREELAQQLLELALADVHPVFNRLWLRLNREPQSQRLPDFYAELYLTLKAFRRQWHALDWDSVITSYSIHYTKLYESSVAATEP